MFATIHSRSQPSPGSVDENEPALDEDVARDAGDVLLDERRAVGDEIQAVGGEEVLEFEAVDAGRVGLLHVKIVLVVVVGVDDADAERG